jgi:putative MATE family efflux protein
MNPNPRTPSVSAPGPEPRLLPPYLQMLAPLIAAHVLQSIGGLVDAMWIGHLLGLRGVAAASAFFPAFFVILSIIIGMSAGVSVLVGKAWGAGDAAGLHRTASTALWIAAGAGLAVAAVGCGSAGALMQLLGTPADVLDEATAYARTAFLGMPLTFTLWTCIALSRGAGDPASPMWAILVATVVGATATPLLITGAAGTGALGLRGAALSSLLAQSVALAVLLLRWRRSGHALLGVVVGFVHSRPDAAIGARVFRIGVPAALQMLSMALAEMVLLGLVNRHGSTVTAAYGAATQLLTWIQFPAMCLGIAASILSAHVIGAGRDHRVPAVLWTGLVLNAVVTSAFAIAGHAAAPVALRLFLQDAEALSIAVGFTRSVAWSIVLLGWSNVIVGTLRARGDVTAPTLLGLASILGIQLPAAMWLESAHGVAGLWWAYPIGFGAMLLLHAGYCALRRGPQPRVRIPGARYGAGIAR